jgi:hypothetical protein
MRRVVYNLPDFASVKSVLEEELAIDGIEVLFLPKFHCELNPIEMCWGFAKRLYRLCPESSKEEDLERNTINLVDAIPLVAMRRFVNRTTRFADAYQHGLNGAEAAWAGKQYHGHRMLPAAYCEELEQAPIAGKVKNVAQKP